MKSRLKIHKKTSVIHFIAPLIVLIAVLGHSLHAQAVVVGPRCYVDDSNGAPGDGTSWGSAFTDLQLALASPGCTEIWVAEGTYLPDRANPGDRSLSFVLKSGVAMYGGFFGDELFLDDRDPVTNVTILSADIGAGGDTADNSFNVVRGGGADATAILDGFTIANGYGDGSIDSHRIGAGIYNDASTPTLTNLIIKDNYAARYGGGMANVAGSHVTLSNVLFENNITVFAGGGIYNENSDLSVSNSTFSGNEGGEGGAIHSTVYSTVYPDVPGEFSMNVANVTFFDNQSNGGGAVSLSAATDQTLRTHMTNVTSSGNDALRAGSIQIGSLPSSPPRVGGTNIVTLNNVILWGNTVVYWDDGQEISTLDYGTPGTIFLNIDNSVIAYGDTDSFTSAAYNAGTGNLNTNPRLMPPADNGGYTPTMALIPGSSAIDAGDDTVCGKAIGSPDFGAGGLDQRGVSRPQGDQCDIGAYEREPTAPKILHAQTDGTSFSCESWGAANACQLQDALALAVSGDQVWVKAGTYLPDGASPGDSSLSFVLVDGVGIYGGFAGSEVEFDSRDPAANLTILSGNIGDAGDATDNSWHVVNGVGIYGGVDSTAVLDGFTIEGGYADGANTASQSGGGIYNLGSSPTLSNLVLRDNHADKTGGGMHNDDSSPTLESMVFFENHATQYGGGMSNLNGSQPNLTNVSFNANTASGGVAASGRGSAGAGMYCMGSNPVLNHVTFNSNIAESTGAGMYLDDSDSELTNVFFINNSALAGGAMGVSSSSPTLMNVLFDSNHATGVGSQGGYGGAMLMSGFSNPVLTNVTATGNTAEKGGAIFNSYSTTTIKNSTIAGMNVASTGQGQAIYSGNGTLLIENSIFYANGPSSNETGFYLFSSPGCTMKDSITQSFGGCVGGFICTNVTDSDPLLGPLADNGGFTQTMALLEGSAALDTGGVNTTCAATDQREIFRPQGSGCDIGAYEKLSDLIFGNDFEGGDP